MKYLFYFILIISISSCEKYLDFEGDNVPSKLVVNGLFTRNENVVVHVSTSLSQLDEAPLSAKTNAVVNLLDQNDDLIEELQNNTDGYYYSSSQTDLINSKYSIEVSAPNFETVKGSSKIPVNSMTFSGGSAVVETTTDNGFQENSIVLNLDFAESPTEDQYYGLIMELGFFDEGSGIIEYYIVFPEISDPLVSSTGNAGNEVLFADDLINGKTSDIEITSYSVLTDGITGDVLSPDAVKLRVRSYSREAYEYLKSYDLYTETEFDFLATPVQVFTNIEEGLGVFGGYNEAFFSFDLD